MKQNPSRKFLNKIVQVMVLLACALSSSSQELLADVESVQQRADQIFSEVLSPFCPGRLLRDCPSGQASELKAQIRDQLREGKSEEEITLDLYRRYGEEMRAAPPHSGFGQVAWMATPVFLFMGFILTYLVLRKRQNTSRTTVPELPIDEAMKKRIDQVVSRE